MDLRALFGPSHEEVWRHLARQVGGSLTNGGLLGPTTVEARVGSWTVLLESQVTRGVACTRLHAPYVNPEGFRFGIYRRTLLSDIGKLVGLQDVEIGVPDFDRAFIIQGNDAARLRALFADARVRASIEAQPSVSLELEDGDELQYAVAEGITDLERLRGLFDLFGAVLHRLGHLGSAYETDPSLRSDPLA